MELHSFERCHLNKRADKSTHQGED